MGCLHVSHGEGTTSALKHVELSLFFAREQIERGFISLEHVPAGVMVADALTKSLPAEKFRKFSARLVGSGAGRDATLVAM